VISLLRVLRFSAGAEMTFILGLWSKEVSLRGDFSSRVFSSVEVNIFAVFSFEFGESVLVSFELVRFFRGDNDGPI